MSEQLPDPPWRVLAIGRRKRKPVWWIYLYDCFVTWVYDPDNGMFNWPEWMTVVQDPRNDPEAVEIIRKAKEGT